MREELSEKLGLSEARVQVRRYTAVKEDSKTLYLLGLVSKQKSQVS